MRGLYILYMEQPRNSTNYSISGTDTFRLGSRMLTVKLTRPPRDGKVGSNLQNIEKSMRIIYIPDDGKGFVQVDQSGAEALIVAYLCKHGNFRELFIHGIKPHCYVALFVFKDVWKRELKDTGVNIDELCNTPIRELTKNPYWSVTDKFIRKTDSWPSEKRYYYISKQICHAANYGMKFGMFQLNTLEKSKGKIVISKKDAEFYLDTYHGLFPEIHGWHREVQDQLVKTKTLYNLFGFPREFWFCTNDVPTHILNKAYSFPGQSTVACITRKAFIDTYNYIEKNNLDWDILEDTHDSFLTQCPIDEAKQCAKVMSDFINIELTSPVDGVKFRMKSESQSGLNWSPASNDNPDGLKEILI